MKHTYSKFAMTAFLAAVIAAAPAAAARTTHTTTVSQVSLSSIKDMESLAYTASQDAEVWKTFAQNPHIDLDSHRNSLQQLRRKVNRMGTELASLEARRASLDPAEQHAIDAVLPLLKDTAANLEAATLVFNRNPGQLWTLKYRANAATTASDCAKIATTLRNCLRYERAHQAEQHLESIAGVGSN